MNYLKRTLLALESICADGSKKKELELVYYVQGADLNAIRAIAVSSEIQEQYAYRTDGGTLRMRSVTSKTGQHEDLNDSYILTSKVWQQGTFGKEEVEVVSTEAMFEHFKILFPQGMYKERLCVPHGEGLKFEVDIFYKEDGSPQDWIKVDLELPESLVAQRDSFTLPETLQGTRAIVSQYGERTSEEEAEIKTLYSTVFSTKPA